MSAIQSEIGGMGNVLRRSGLLVGAILVSLALLSAAASSASAKEQRGFFLAGEKSEEVPKQPRFEGEIYPTYLATKETVNFEFGFQVGTLKCPGDFSGQLSGAASEVAITSFYYYFACKTPFGGALTITANGCENTLTLLNEGPPYVGRWGYKCPAGVYYEFHEGGTKCTFAIPSQTGLAEVKLKNTGEGKQRSVEVTLNVSKLKYTLKGSPFLCKPGEYENGTITGTMILNGYDKAF